MKRTNTGKNMEGGVLFGFSPKYSTTDTKVSCTKVGGGGDIQTSKALYLRRASLRYQSPAMEVK